MSKSILKEKSFSFAVRTVHLYQHLQARKCPSDLNRQLLRSGTSVGANIREAQNAVSKADFMHKLGIAQKEADETVYWLDLLAATGYLGTDDHVLFSGGAAELLKMIRSSILTLKKQGPNNS